MSWISVVTPPAEEPVALEDMKAFLRIATTSEDALVQSLIAAARAQFEDETCIACVTRRLKRHWHRWPDRLWREGIYLLPQPAATLVSVELTNADGAVQTLTDRFALTGGRLQLRAFQSVPDLAAGGYAAVTFNAGFGGASAVPEAYRLALQQRVADAYQREDRGADAARTPGREIRL